MSTQDVEKGAHNNGVGRYEGGPKAFHAGVPPGRTTNIGNPGPLGLFSFASTTLVLSLYNVATGGIAKPNVVVGMALFTGGLAQFLAGMWEFPRGNMFGGVAFTSYGSFWLSFASIYIPGAGILEAYGEDEVQLHNALGVYLLVWMWVTFLLMVAALRKNVGFILLLGFLTLTFLLLGVAEFKGSAMITKAGGAFGIITALIAYYCGLSELLVYEESYVTLPLGILPKRD